jgi:hypothetical protein
VILTAPGAAFAETAPPVVLTPGEIRTLSQKSVPMHPRVSEALVRRKNAPFIANQKTGFLQAGITMEGDRIEDKRFAVTSETGSSGTWN